MDYLRKTLAMIPVQISAPNLSLHTYVVVKVTFSVVLANVITGNKLIAQLLNKQNSLRS